MEVQVLFAAPKTNCVKVSPAAPPLRYAKSSLAHHTLLIYLCEQSMSRKIGIFSGSFDPVHAGHIAFAQEAMRVCKLDELVFMPERFPRGKPNVSPISERITELEIALAETPFTVLDAQADQFTVDETLTELEVLYPNVKFTFLIGSDIALNLPKWENIERLSSRYEFAIGIRNSDATAIISETMQRLDIARYTLITTPHAHLSSSSIRA